MSASKLASKTQHLSQERSKMERKYKMFRETKNALIKNVDKLAREGVAATANKKQEPRGGCKIPHK